MISPRLDAVRVNSRATTGVALTCRRSAAGAQPTGATGAPTPPALTSGAVSAGAGAGASATGAAGAGVGAAGAEAAGASATGAAGAGVGAAGVEAAGATQPESRPPAPQLRGQPALRRPGPRPAAQPPERAPARPERERAAPQPPAEPSRAGFPPSRPARSPSGRLPALRPGRPAPRGRLQRGCPGLRRPAAPPPERPGPGQQTPAAFAGARAATAPGPTVRPWCHDPAAPIRPSPPWSHCWRSVCEWLLMSRPSLRSPPPSTVPTPARRPSGRAQDPRPCRSRELRNAGAGRCCCPWFLRDR